jgi:importin subunit beta-1
MADDMEPDRLPKATVDQILTTIVSGMQKDLPIEMRRAAVGALLNSLSFTHHNFDVDSERNAIMTVICESTQCADVQVRVKAFECISDIATMYYSKLRDYAKALFDITSNAVKNDDPLVGQYAIEFWSSVAEEEFDILDNIDSGDSEGAVLLGLVEGAAQSLVPILLETLTKQTSDTADDDDEWNIALASAACIEKLTLVLGDKIIDQVLPFVGACVTNPDWKFREAAIMSFASILEGTSSHKMEPIIAGGLGSLIPCLADSSPIVRDSTAWAISRVFQFHPTAVTPAMLPSVVEAVLRTLQDRNPRIACLAALALHHMAEACQDSADQQTNTLSPFFVSVLGSLFQVSARPDGDEGNLAATAYEAINVMIANSAIDTKPLVIQSMTEIIGRLETTMNVSGDMHDRLTLQSLLCGSLGACVQKLDKESVMPHADRMMHLLLMVFKEKSAIAHEDAFITTGFIADTLQADFIRYMPHFIDPLLQGLRHVDEHSVVVMAAGVVGDLSRALQKQLVPYAEPIMTHLVQLLQSPVLHRSASQ